ncbi:histidine kinase, partial [Acinetobacter baumannii]
VRAENRQLEQKQRLARELQIEREASFHQRQFMGMVAHEFRTPLAVIQAALENLRLSAASTSQEARFDRIGRAATRLVQLTDNCLADARLASH